MIKHLLSLFLVTTALSAPVDKPNFIVINIDDLGYADIGPYGSKLNRTPHLDRMAAEGMKLTCHYAAPVCSPSRSALMTGCYPKRVLPIPGVLFPAGAKGLHPDEVTVAEVLKGQGYATACVGKWHLGDQPEFLPNAQGFDHYLGIPYSNDMGTAAEGSKSDLGQPLPKVATKAAPPALNAAHGGDETGVKGNGQPPLPLVQDGKVISGVPQDKHQELVQIYTEDALKFIRSNQSKPFFLYLPHNAVHFPLYPGKAFHGKSKNGLLGDWVEEVDWSVGQVLDTLRELKLDSRTLVIFTSDNGGTPRSDNTPLRGHKGSTLEGGMRACTLAWWPGQVPAGSSTAEVTSMMDILPTFAALSGAKLPDRKLDGGDLTPLLFGKADARSPHHVFFYFRGFNLEAIRQGPWKLQLLTTGKAPTKGKKAPAERLPQLYNLVDDIGESKNLAADKPELVKELQALAQKMDADLGTKEIGPGCRPLGSVASPQPLIGHDGTIRSGFR
jgi:arylsulfatase A